MTQTDQTLPPTKLMDWYSNLENKSEAIRLICYKTGVSNTYATNWLKGLSKSKKPEQIKALEEITGIPGNEIFEFVKK